MSHREREERNSDCRYRRPKFDPDPSPKRYRRYEKAEEGAPRKSVAGNHVSTGQERSRFHHLQNSLTNDPTLKVHPDTENTIRDNENATKQRGYNEGSRHLTDPTEVPRSRSYFEHDERHKSRQVGRSNIQRSTAERHGRDSKQDRNGELAMENLARSSHEGDKMSKLKEDEPTWGHDGFFNLESKLPYPPPPPPPPPACELSQPQRKRPAFRERKMPVEASNELQLPNNLDHSIPVSERRRLESRHSDLGGKYRTAGPNGFGGGQGIPDVPSPRRNGRRERTNTRQWYPRNESRDMWKHDLFEEANRSQIVKNEEDDDIARIEALLAS